MNQAQIDAMMRGIAPVLRQAIGETVEPLVRRLIVLESREPLQGEPGRDGKDGAPGEQGQRGEQGPAGEPGRDGVDGRDGKDAYAGEVRGLFDPTAEYRERDMVTLNGSEWRAKHDNPGPLPGDGWVLSAMRGKAGYKGDRGERGPQGAPGVSTLAVYVKGTDLVLTQSDGTEIKADLQGLAEIIRRELGQ